MSFFDKIEDVTTVDMFKLEVCMEMGIPRPRDSRRYGT